MLVWKTYFGTAPYEYAYPLVLQTLSEKIATDVPSVSGTHAPVNQLANLTLAPLSAGYGPNADTLYSFGWLDLSKEPIVLHVPNTNGRFYSFELIDAWTNAFTVIGQRTTGTAEGDYAIVGPNWTGTLPAGVTEVQSPTDLVQFIGRTLVYGQGDVPAATAMQQQYSLTPLSDYGTAYTPPTTVPTG
jgi:DNA sulfur modification protein DndE